MCSMHLSTSYPVQNKHEANGIPTVVGGFQTRIGVIGVACLESGFVFLLTGVVEVD